MGFVSAENGWSYSSKSRRQNAWIICKALMLLKSKGNLGSLIDLDETRSRPIKVVPQHEIELGISHRNGTRRPFNVCQLTLESFQLRGGEVHLQRIFNNSEPAIQLSQAFLDKPPVHPRRKTKNWENNGQRRNQKSNHSSRISGHPKRKEFRKKRRAVLIVVDSNFSHRKFWISDRWKFSSSLKKSRPTMFFLHGPRQELNNCRMNVIPN